MSRLSVSRRRLLGWLALPLGSVALPAAAQLIEDPETVVIPPEPPITTARSVFVRDNEIPVADRVVPAFSAQGTKLGNFDLYPGLALGTFFDNNVFADNSRRHSDVAFVARPEATLRTSQGPYQLAAYARGDFRRYLHYGSENTNEGLGGLEGAVAIGALSSLIAGASYGSLVEPRYAADSPTDAARPLGYTALTGYAGGTIEGASTRVIVRGDLSQLHFRETPSRFGGIIDTRDRDRTRLQGLVRVERSINASTSIYLAGTGNTIRYRYQFADAFSRNSTGYGAYVGSNFDITNLMHGDVRVGYIRQSFDLARVRPISGLGLLGTVTYFPSRLITLTAHAESSVQDSGVPGTTGLLHTGGSLRSDLELRRYIISGFEAGYYHDTYRGEERRDKLPYADIDLTYLSAHHWNARVGYRYLSRHCNCQSGVQSFDDHRLSATLTFQY